MPFQVYLTSTSGTIAGMTTVHISSPAFREGGRELTLGPPGATASESFTTDPDNFYTIRVEMKVAGNWHDVQVSEVGSDDTLVLVALANQLDYTSQVGAYFLGTFRHAAHSATRHCIITCDGRQQECCIECGTGLSQSKICC